VLVQALLALYASHRWIVLARFARLARAAPPAPPAPPADGWPAVTVQLPVYNERLVVERLIDHVAALDYPADRLEIQVLDDSSDDTGARAAAAVARHRSRGVDIVHLRRVDRSGYKAGALAAGLRRARGGLVAVFDADFTPRPDFLRRLVPHFADPRVGMVQARWTHLNAGRSWLTGAQAAMLDSHFLLEHRVRLAGGLFFNFNGTAGVWRRACIEDAGGWSHDTLTEDLDLSYRAQLRGWRFVFDATVAAPAELPADMEGFKAQQRRWAKGSIQTARKLLPRVLASPLPARVKLEAAFHLTSNAAYPLLLALAVLLPPVLLAPATLPRAAVWALQALLLGFGLLPVALFLAVARRAAGAGPGCAARDAAAALVLGVGLSVSNARAVLEGLGRRTGEFVRTPKSGDGAAAAHGPRYRPAAGARGAVEFGFALYAVALGALAVDLGAWRSVPFALLLLTGWLSVGLGSWRAGRSGRAATA
jgi:cellulose synthase/poly-beta-1,6-N-acetylglucosamine synthase-like glycosyltransferase